MGFKAGSVNPLRRLGFMQQRTDQQRASKQAELARIKELREAAKKNCSRETSIDGYKVLVAAPKGWLKSLEHTEHTVELARKFNARAGKDYNAKTSKALRMLAYTGVIRGTQWAAMPATYLAYKNAKIETVGFTACTSVLLTLTKWGYVQRSSGGFAPKGSTGVPVKIYSRFAWTEAGLAWLGSVLPENVRFSHAVDPVTIREGDEKSAHALQKPRASAAPTPLSAAHTVVEARNQANLREASNVVLKAVTAADSGVLLSCAGDAKAARAVRRGAKVLRAPVLTSKVVFRAYNSSDRQDLSKGGRIYAAYQGLSAKARLKTYIGGEKVTALDATASLLQVACAISGQSFDKDPYKAAGKEISALAKSDGDPRDFAKAVVTRALNVRRKQDLVASLRKNPPKGFEYLESAPNLHTKRMIQAVLSSLGAVVDKMFFQGPKVGQSLIRKEALFFETLWADLYARGVFTLSVHDELLVPRSKAPIAKKLAEDAWAALFPGGSAFVCKLVEG